MAPGPIPPRRPCRWTGGSAGKIIGQFRSSSRSLRHTPFRGKYDCENHAKVNNRPNSQKRLRARRRRRHGNHRVRVAIWRHGETLTNGQNLVLRRAWPAVWDCRARRGSRGTCAPPLGLGGRTMGLSRWWVRGYRRCEGGRYGLSLRVCCGLPYVVRYARARSTILLLRS